MSVLGTRAFSLFLVLAAHVLTSPHHLVDEKKLLGEHWRNIQELSLDYVVVPHCGDGSRQRLSRVHINTEGIFVFQMSLLDLKQGFLRVEARVLSKGARNHQQSFSEGLHAELHLSFDLPARELIQVL